MLREDIDIMVAKVDIPKGTIITEEKLSLKRPGYGIEPKYVDILIGRKAKKDVEEGEPINWAMIEL